MEEVNIAEVEIEEEKKGLWQKLKPSSLTAYTFEVIFLTILVVSLAKFPLSKFMSGNLSKDISFGWPFSFFNLSFQNPGGFPINIVGGILDLLIYFIVSYAFDLIVSSLGRTYKKSARKREEKEEKAKRDNGKK